MCKLANVSKSGYYKYLKKAHLKRKRLRRLPANQRSFRQRKKKMGAQNSANESRKTHESKEGN
jgi:hypothetical protein